MAVTSNQIRDQINRSFSRLSPKHKLILFVGLAVALALIFVVFAWTASPSYEVLFSNLSQKDAGKILEKLKEKNLDYKLEGSGTTIMVPAREVYELRLEFAQSGLPESSSVGYEIFDKTNLGMTDFIQQVNYRRALEGELSQTIDQIESVEKSRVHIVIPEKALFKEDENPTTASVILKLKGNGLPPRGTVEAISHLVASSVEGLEPENISILDTRGRMLSDNQDPNNMMALSATQLDFSRKVESYLTQKTQSMLDPVLGPGNAVVRVTADLNFTQVEKNIEQYDPDNTAIRSEEINEENTPLSAQSTEAAGKAPAAKRNSTVTNYEVNKTVERVVEGVGNIERLSVAVMVNNKQEIVTGEDGNKEIKYVPRSEEEIATLTELVRMAVGFQSERNDQISVMNVDFTGRSLENEMMTLNEPTFWDNWYQILEKVFLILAIAASMLIMRSLFRQVRKRNEEVQAQVKSLEKEIQYAELPAGKNFLPDTATKSLPKELSAEARSKAEEFLKTMEGTSSPLDEEVQQYIRTSPEEAARLIKSWLLEDEETKG